MKTRLQGTLRVLATLALAIFCSSLAMGTAVAPLALA